MREFIIMIAVALGIQGCQYTVFLHNKDNPPIKNQIRIW